MALNHTAVPIQGNTPDTQYSLHVFEIGSGPYTIYLQAALHADEQPGTMVLHHLLPLLELADKQGRLNARFIIIPMANPLGLQQIRFGKHQGRYYEANGVNFNRQWQRLFPHLHDQLQGKLSSDGTRNKALVRAAMQQYIDGLHTPNAGARMRKTLMQYAAQADIVLDLHCDNEALVHIFTAPQCSTEMERLASYIKAEGGVLTAADSGGGSFDEIWTLVWSDAANAFQDYPIEMGCISATLEYRGEPDVYDHYGIEDAHGLMNYFMDRGFVGQSEDFTKLTPQINATPLNATEIIRADKPGLLAYRVELGDRVQKGDVIAELIAVDGDKAFQIRTPIKTGTDGTVISRLINKYVWSNCAVCKIVGNKPLESRGDYLLED